MKRSNRLLMMALFAMLAICFSSCKDSESILLSKQEVWFPIEAEWFSNLLSISFVTKQLLKTL